jgi:hypothetical protein
LPVPLHKHLLTFYQSYQNGFGFGPIHVRCVPTLDASPLLGDSQRERFQLELDLIKLKSEWPVKDHENDPMLLIRFASKEPIPSA